MVVKEEQQDDKVVEDADNLGRPLHGMVDVNVGTFQETG
jgi:hypothetical protein